MRVEFRWTRGFGDILTEVVEYDDSDFDGKTDEQVEEIINDDFSTWVWDHVDAAWTKIE